MPRPRAQKPEGSGRRWSALGGLWLLVPLACCGGPLLITSLAAAGALAWGGLGLALAAAAAGAALCPASQAGLPAPAPAGSAGRG